MEVSKLTLSEEMERAIHNPRVSLKRKRELRTARVKEYINSLPAGTEISKRTLGQVAGYQKTSLASSYVFIDSLIKSGEIHCERISRNKMSWSTDDGVRIITPKTSETSGSEEIDIIETKSSDDGIKSEVKDVEEVTLNRFNLEYQAKLFVWEENSDSIREFVKWLKQNDKI